MKILQVHNRYRSSGGEDAVVAAEARLLNDAGHKVDQYIVDNPQNDFRAAGMLALSAWNPFAARKVVEAATNHRVDVAHVHNTWFSLSTSVLRGLRSVGVPVVMTLHNYRSTCLNGQLLRNGKECVLCVGKHPLNGVRYRCYKASVPASLIAAAANEVARFARVWTRDVTLFVVMTEFARQIFIAAGIPERKIRVKPHFVDDPGPRSSEPSSSGSVIYVGRLGVEKGVDVLLDAWEGAGISDLKLVVIGDGPLRAGLERREVDAVRFVGWRSRVDVQNSMLSARALVFPSVWHESFGLAVVEAMAAGCPVLASDIGGVRAMLGEPGPPWIGEPGDAAALRRRLDILNDGPQLDLQGRLLRDLYEQRYTPAQGVELLCEIYAEAITAR